MIINNRKLNPDKHNDKVINNKITSNMFDRKTLPNESLSNRMNTSILSPLKNNPYVKSLNSSVNMTSH